MAGHLEGSFVLWERIWQGKKSEEKEQKKCFEEETVDTPLKVILTLLLKNISSEILSEAVLSKVSKLIH